MNPSPCRTARRTPAGDEIGLSQADQRLGVLPARDPGFCLGSLHGQGKKVFVFLRVALPELR